MTNKNNERGPSETLSLDEAARNLKISKPTLYRWLESGRIQGIKVGKQWRFREADLQALMEVRDPAARRRLAAIQSADALLRSASGKKQERGEFMETVEILHSEEERIACKVLKGILGGAAERMATDVHLEPFDRGVRVRERIGGKLREGPSLPRESIEPMVRAIRRLSSAGMTDGPTSDGKLLFSTGGHTVDVRYNIFPSVHGGAVAMRLLDPEGGALRPLDGIGLEKDDLERLKGLIRRHGLVVVTGPSGTGKTTLLYAILRELAAEGRKAMTVEDPVEFILDGVVQSQVRAAEGYTFPVALRSMLRQATEVMMCAEIRDAETLRMLAAASMTGHLCLSALHAPDAVRALRRMADHGIEPSQITDALSTVIAVRTLPRICPGCRKDARPDGALIRELGLSPEEASGGFFRGAGCAKCHKTGSGGLTLIYEMLVPTPEIKAALLSGADETALAAAAGKAGMATLRARGLAKARAGEVALEDLARVLPC